MAEKIEELNRTLTKYEKKYITRNNDYGNKILNFAFYFMMVMYIILLGLMVLLWADNGNLTLPVILSLVFTLLFIPLLKYIHNRKDREITFVPPFKIQGFFKEVITGFGKQRAVKYYIGPCSVSVPEHWITLGFLKKADIIVVRPFLIH